jgi:hypothetical protein
LIFFDRLICLRHLDTFSVLFCQIVVSEHYVRTQVAPALVVHVVIDAFS